jgi:hypothetical protein
LLNSNDVAISALNSNLSGVGSVIVEPVLAFSAAGFSVPSQPTAADWAGVQTALSSYITAASSNILGRLGTGGGPAPMLVPGAEVVAQGPITLTGLDLSPAGSNWRFNGAPADLTVLATGNVTVAGAVSDGFTTTVVDGLPQTVLLSGTQAGPSSFIRLVAGADLTSANPLATAAAAAGSAALTLAPGAVVRTGTGEIDLVSAGDVVVGAGASAYTAGVPAIAPGGTASNPYPNVPTQLGVGTAYGIELSPNKNGLVFSFPTGGGPLVVRAGGDIQGSVLTDPGPSNWLLYQGGTSYSVVAPDGTVTTAVAPAQWGINLSAFNWNFGTLGGGDLSLTAGGNILTVTGASTDTRVATPGSAPLLTASGGLAVYAGKDIASAQLYLADGTGTVTANGALTAVLPSELPNVSVGSALYLQDSSLAVQSRLGTVVDGLYNPTEILQPAFLSPGAKSLGSGFFSYGDDSSVSLTATAGDLQLGGAVSVAPAVLWGPMVSAAGGGASSIAPPNLSLVALNGNVLLGGAGGALGETMYPSANGQLSVIAAGNISTPSAPAGPALIMSDSPPALVASVSNPGLTGSPATPFLGAIHSGDTTPALVVAGGDITELNLSVPKAADIEAGQNIVDLVLAGQNLSPAQATLVSAGHDILYQQTCTTGCGIAVGGPGQLEVIAGHTVDLGFSSGITTNGNLLNPNLPSAAGASLTVLAGAASAPTNAPAALTDLMSTTNTTADLAALAALPASTAAGFGSDLSKFQTTVVGSSAAYQWEFQYFVRGQVIGQGKKDPGPLSFSQAEALFTGFSTTQQEQWLSVLGEFMHGSAANQQALLGYVETATGSSGLTLSQALSAYSMLTPVAQRPFIDQVYFGELTASGSDANLLPGVAFSRGDAAIDAVFPGTRAATASGADFGDVSLVFSRIYTLSGGDISLLAPGGLLNVGLANPPASLASRSPSTLGIVAQGTGDVSVYTSGDVDVNASRVFTLGGGNILMWSNYGSIDAGRGAKSSVSAPPPQVLIASNGTVTLDFSGAATGSGIRTIQTDASVPPGNVSLIAPNGTVNAGDAGIGAAGNLNIAAQRVLGLDNIQVGGTSTGVPATVSALGASLSGASAAGAGTTTAATEAATAAGEAAAASAASVSQATMDWLDVFVIGLGEENCKPEDLECLKRQKRP